MDDSARTRRYWAKVDVRGDDDCWPWTACHNSFGYGMFRGGTEQLAHRYGYLIAYGPIPVGLVVCHRCDNPPCQNPAHFFIGTPQDNWADMTAKGRRRPGYSPGERNGMARFTDAQVDEMCTSYRKGLLQTEIAERFGTTQSVVSKLLRTRGGMRPSSRRATGLRNVNGRLTPDDVAEIRRAYSVGDVSQATLASRFGVSQPTVSAIIREATHRSQN